MQHLRPVDRLVVDVALEVGLAAARVQRLHMEGHDMIVAGESKLAQLPLRLGQLSYLAKDSRREPPLRLRANSRPLGADLPSDSAYVAGDQPRGS
jgi:hypothetical protein